MLGQDQYLTLKLSLGAIATVALFSVLYKENKLYRLFEHIFLGLAAGWAIVTLWAEVLKPIWLDNMLGVPADVAAGEAGKPGFFLYAALPAVGLMAYFVFSPKLNWMSRIPIGILLGFAAGQAFEAFQNYYTGQIAASLRPIVPTTFETWSTPNLTTPDPLVAAQLYPAEALNNLVFMLTILLVIGYFIFSIDLKGKFLRGATTAGRWLMMIGFGAIFGSTVMMRFSLLIDRMYFVFVEFLQQGIFRIGV